MHTVYQITCKKTGRRYYGQTGKNLSDRFSSHICDLKKSRHCNKSLQNDFLTFNINDFSASIIAVTNNKKEALLIEKIAIQSDPDSYNVLIGTVRPMEIAREFGLKASITRKNKHWKPTPESRKKMSDAKRGKPGVRIGSSWSEEQRERYSISRTGKRLEAKWKTVISSDGRSWPSLSHAATDVGCHPSNIARVCNGKRSSYRGVSFKYA